MRVTMTYRKNYVKKKDIMTLCKNTVQKDLVLIDICKQICDLQGLRVNVVHKFYLIVSEKKTHDKNQLYHLLFIWYLKST